jgi:diguanylate cyclase (GGDEF)-like protein/PAS domain S-box-containing protein
MSNEETLAAKIGALRAQLEALAGQAGGMPVERGLHEVAAALAELNAAAEAVGQSELRFRTATEIAQALVYERDFHTGMAHFYSDVDAPLGYAPGEYPRTVEGWAELTHPDDLLKALEQVKENFATGAPNTIRYRLRRKDGSYSGWLDRSILVSDSDGKPLTWVGIAIDISAQLEAEKALRESQQMLRLVLDAIPVGVFWKDKDLKYVGCNRKFAEDAGLKTTDEIRGKDDWDMPWADRAEVHQADDRRVMQTGAPIHGSEEPTTTADGGDNWVRVSKIPLVDADGAVSGVLGTYEDITAWKRSEEQLKHTATHDSLTGLPNRVLLYDRLQQTLARGRRQKSFNAFLLLDLDRFKEVNDRFGHGAGDEFLRQVAGRLTGCLRPYDTLARLGGDEFVVILGGLADAQDCAAVANRIVGSLRTPIPIGAAAVRTACSAGITVMPADGADLETLLHEADRAMYAAKEKGGDCFCFFSRAMNAAVDEGNPLVADLQRAIADHEFVLHYQPVIDLQSEQIAGVEALVRWEHPHDGLIYPLSFIEVAEASGLIAPINAWVLNAACEQGAAWRRAGLATGPVAVNLSAGQIADKDTVAGVATALAESGLPPSGLAIEVKEAEAMQDAEAAAGLLHGLRGLGVQIVLDDFGAGNSSLAWLKRVPFDVLKIDRYLVRRLVDDPENAAIVKLILTMAQALGIRVVAKGVEAPEQLAVLRSLRQPRRVVAEPCDAQGYLFSRPVSADALTKFVRERSR